jgi:hypothetical protein
MKSKAGFLEIYPTEVFKSLAGTESHIPIPTRLADGNT